MQLSDISYIHGELYQNGAFSIIGNVYSKEKNRLVPIQNKDELIYCLNHPEITGIIISSDHFCDIPENIGVIISKTPLDEAINILKNYFPEKINKKQDGASIHPSVKIHPTADISLHQVTIGKNVRINEYVTIEPGTHIGNDVIIDAHAHIGIPELRQNNSLKSSSKESNGKIIINNGVYIHPNCTIEKPIFPDSTTIGRDCHIDSISSIGAGVTLGSFSLVAGLVSIGKYSNVGPRTWIGPGCLISPGIDIGDSCYVTLGSKVTKTIGPNKIVKDNWGVNRDKFKGIIS